jgi:multiple sugar transport system substrate-binding protein
VIRLVGMTWDHRRAVQPLVALNRAFAELRPDVEIAWRRRPRSGFEFDPIERLAQENDLIIFDHPFCGRIAATGCLLSVATIIEDAGGQKTYVGPSAGTYRFGGGDWAVPVDAACQVAAYRPDLLSKASDDVPRSWEDVCALAKRCAGKGLSIAIGLRGVHALMTFFSLCASLGRPFATDAEGPDAGNEAAGEALAQMRRLVGLCRAPVLDWNSIEVQEALSGSEDMVYCPAVYGFAAYGESDRPHPLAFGPFPGLASRAPHAGSTIGGAGLGVSGRVAEDSQRREAALAYARLAADGPTQCAVFARHHGQPAHIAAWCDAEIDRSFNGFFSATRSTIDASWVRPRYDGYLGFQARAGAVIESHLRGEIEARETVERLVAMDLACRAGGSG